MRLAFALSIVLVSGCTVVRVQPLTLDEVIERHKAGASEEKLISEVEVAGTRYYLSVADVVKLREAGVPDPVIDRMLASAWRPSRVYYRHDPWNYDPYWRFHFHHSR